ncbi:hypothetical protein [Novilysobacter erysipheiresistens]|uniref:Uncharacterized protein n=1 Tax=Novilysobacter erysipheiresistens TaxID=1749332 RepID=A0ABU7YUM5_9GAMM
MSARTYLCDECDGHGAISLDGLHSHDPAHDDRGCRFCGETGVITADDDEADARSLQPWNGDVGRAAHRINEKHTDPLAELARTRAINPKSWAYEYARLRAMRPVSRLAQTDMLAMAQRCVNVIEDMRADYAAMSRDAA